MLTKLIQAIFVPKRARAKLSAPDKASSRQGPQTAGGGRDKLLSDAMAVYRQQRQDVYESLDEATKRRIEQDAETAFGKALRSKD